MNFEAQLDELYIEITNHISDMIPERWENVCLNAFIGDNKRYVYFHYMVPGED
ncbi:immunity protein YezG family protein, partial [Staphylococcus epidermidis]